jgi:hypothetical protein
MKILQRHVRRKIVCGLHSNTAVYNMYFKRKSMMLGWETDSTGLRQYPIVR